MNRDLVLERLERLEAARLDLDERAIGAGVLVADRRNEPL